MRVLDKIALAMFSVLILAISVVYILLYCGIMDQALAVKGIEIMVNEEPSKFVFLGLSIICILLSIKAILFDADSYENIKTPVEIEGDNGTLEIMPNTIEAIASMTLKNYTVISEAIAKMQSKKDGIVMNITCMVKPDTIITELVSEMQKNVKEKIETQTSAHVLEVNIRVKDLKMPKQIEEKEE